VTFHVVCNRLTHVWAAFYSISNDLYPWSATLKQQLLLLRVMPDSTSERRPIEAAFRFTASSSSLIPSP